jgi:Protein of unknown function (DUF1348)
MEHCDPQRVAQGYTPECHWRNRAEFVNGRDEIIGFFTRKSRSQSANTTGLPAGGRMTTQDSAISVPEGRPPDGIHRTLKVGGGVSGGRLCSQ